MSASLAERPARAASPQASIETASSGKAACETCGNVYDKSFQVVIHGHTHVFDCFECAIQMLAPTCEHCGCRIIGHGLEENGQFFCCAHCAHHEGAEQVTDRA